MKELDQISNEMTKVFEKYQYVVLGGILLTIFAFDYFFFMKPQLNTLNTLSPKLTILRQDITQATDNIAQIDFYRSEIGQLKEKFKKSDFKILSKEEANLILEGISRLATQNKVKIDQILPFKGPPELLLKNKEGSYYSFPIRLEAKGGYHDIGRFLDQLERDNVFKSITALTIVSNADDPTHHSIKLTVKSIILEKAEGPGGS